MSNILFISSNLPIDHLNGQQLRVYYISRELAKYNNCYLITFDQNNESESNIQNIEFFRNIIRISKPKENPHFSRHFRYSNRKYVQIKYPQYFEHVNKSIQAIINKYAIDIVIAFHVYLVEYIIPLRNVLKIIDDFDCITLRLKREYSIIRKELKFFEKLKFKVQLLRNKNLEHNLASKVDLVTTISPSDFSALQRLNVKKKSNLYLLPNGVKPEILDLSTKNVKIKNTIIFWGNFNFHPNLHALEYFYNNVFFPYFSERDIKLFIVGPVPNARIIKGIKSQKNIIFTGYIKDLYSFAAKIPIMINPMISGSGLKNKVLEAFALNCLVISSKMGIEAFPGLRDGMHYIRADNGKEYSEAILYYLNVKEERDKIVKNAKQYLLDNFTWEYIIRQFNSDIDSLLLQKEELSSKISMAT